MVNFMEKLKRFVIKSPLYMDALPVHLQVEPSTFCDMECKICCRKRYVKQPRNLAFDKFKEILYYFKDLRSINIQGWGEPLLNPDIVKMVKYAKSIGIYVHIYTNGTFLDKWGEELINVELDELRISVDGANSRTFKKIRKGGDFYRVINNIKTFVNLKKSMSNKQPKVTIRVTVMKENLFELEDIISLASEIGVDKVRLSKLVLDRNTEMATEEQDIFALNKHMVQSIFSKLEATTSLELSIDPFIKSILRGNRYYKRLKPLFRKTLYRQKYLCEWLWDRCFVDINGRVHPCCYFWFGEERHSIKFNILEEDNLHKIWNCAEYVNIRKGLITGNLPPICEKCEVIRAQL